MCQTTAITRSKLLLGKVSILDEKPNANMTLSILRRHLPKRYKPLRIHLVVAHHRLSNLLQCTPISYPHRPMLQKRKKSKNDSARRGNQRVIKNTIVPIQPQGLGYDPKQNTYYIHFLRPQFWQKVFHKVLNTPGLLDHSKPSLTTVHMKTAIGHLKFK
jgi:hypothetical protein